MGRPVNSRSYGAGRGSFSHLPLVFLPSLRALRFCLVNPSGDSAAVQSPPICQRGARLVTEGLTDQVQGLDPIDTKAAEVLAGLAPGGEGFGAGKDLGILAYAVQKSGRQDSSNLAQQADRRLGQRRIGPRFTSCRRRVMACTSSRVRGTGGNVNGSRRIWISSNRRSVRRIWAGWVEGQSGVKASVSCRIVAEGPAIIAMKGARSGSAMSARGGGLGLVQDLPGHRVGPALSFAASYPAYPSVSIPDCGSRVATL
jgi:hypothetical protein